MADHSVLSQLVQLGDETTAGTVAPADKKVSNLMIELAPEGDFTEYRGAGHKIVDSVVPGDEWAGGSASGPLGFGEIIYPLSSIINKPTPTVPAGGTLAQLWEFAVNPYGPDTIATYTVEKGDGTANFRWTYVYFNELTITANRKEANFSGTAVGQTMTAGITMTAGATAVENVIVVPQRFDVFYASSMANLGDLEAAGTKTQIMRAFNWEFRIGNRFAHFFPMVSALTSFAGMVEQAADVTLGLQLGMDTTGSDFVPPITLANMRAGARIFLRLQALGPIIESTTPYGFGMNVAAVVNQPLSWQDTNGLALNGWDMRVITDPISELPFAIQVMNQTDEL